MTEQSFLGFSRVVTLPPESGFRLSCGKHPYRQRGAALLPPLHTPTPAQVWFCCQGSQNRRAWLPFRRASWQAHAGRRGGFLMSREGAAAQLSGDAHRGRSAAKWAAPFHQRTWGWRRGPLQRKVAFQKGTSMFVGVRVTHVPPT